MTGETLTYKSKERKKQTHEQTKAKKQKQIKTKVSEKPLNKQPVESCHLICLRDFTASLICVKNTVFFEILTTITFS